jgi:hypothetical protein
MVRIHLVHLITRIAIATEDLEFTLREIEDQHLIQLFSQLENSTKNVHFALENASTMAASWSWLWCIGSQHYLFILS